MPVRPAVSLPLLVPVPVVRVGAVPLPIVIAAPPGGAVFVLVAAVVPRWWAVPAWTSKDTQRVHKDSDGLTMA